MNDLATRPNLYPWLTNVYVRPDFRGQGIGRLMMETVSEKARLMEIRKLYLCTPLLDFYEKFGWQQLEKVDTFYRQPRQQYIYQLNLE